MYAATMETTRQKVMFSKDGKEYVLYPPTIDEKWLLSHFVNKKRHPLAISFDECYSVGLHGVKGAGKTACLAAIACCALALGIPTYLNFPLAFFLKRKNGQTELLKANFLGLRDFLLLSKDLTHSFVGLSEYQNWASAYRAMSDLNLALGNALQQIRKQELNFYYDVKLLGWIDPTSRFENDISIWCWDLYFTDRERYKEKGVSFYLQAYDMSGRWTGKIYHPKYNPQPVAEYIIKDYRPFWGCYDTHHVIDPMESWALRAQGVKGLLLGDGNGKKPLGYKQIKAKLSEIFANTRVIRRKELWEHFGIDMHDHRAQEDIREIMKDFGIVVKNIKREPCYVLPEYDDDDNIRGR